MEVPFANDGREPVDCGLVPAEASPEEREALQPLVLRLTALAARRVNDPWRANDLAQEAVSRLCAARSNGVVIENETAYTNGILRHLVCEALREQYRISYGEIPEQSVMYELGAAIEFEDSLKIVRAALTKRQYEVYMLVEFDEIARRDVAELLGIKPSTVDSHIKRAMARLRQPDVLADLDPPS